MVMLDLDAIRSGRRIRQFAAISAGIWLVVAYVIMPLVIRSAYHGGSVHPLNLLFSARESHTLDYYLHYWYAKAALPGLAACFGIWLLALLLSTPNFFRRFVGDATPGTLGAIRMLVCAILLLNVIGEDFATISFMPPEMRHSMGVMRLLYLLPLGFEHLVASATGLRLYQVITGLVLFLGLVGWRTRITIPLGAFLFLVFTGLLRQYSFFWHQNLVPLYVMGVLCFMPCGDGWSLDRLIRIAKGHPVPEPDRPAAAYGWGRYAVWVAVALTYVAAGLSKLRLVGSAWWDPDHMRRILYVDTLNPMQFDWKLSLALADWPDGFFIFLALAGVWGELLYGTVLVSRFGRIIMPLAMGFMHIGIVFLQNILFIDLVFLQLIFFDLGGVRRAIGRWLDQRRGRLQVLFDGHCPLCRKTVRVLRALDILGRLQPVDFRRLDLAAYNREHGLALTPDQLESEMYVVTRAISYRGFYGYRIMALAFPATWPLAPFLFVPGLSHAGDRFYRAIARNRLRPLGCSDSCSVGPEADDPASLRPPGRLLVRYPLAVSALCVGLLACWTFKIEVFPLTTMRMYTTKSWSEKGAFVFYRGLGHRENGDISRQNMDAAMGIQAVNGRYRPIIMHCFGRPDRVEACGRFFRAAGAAYNVTAKPGERLARFEIQQWSAPPSDPTQQTLVQRVFVPVVPGGEVAGTEAAPAPALLESANRSPGP